MRILAVDPGDKRIGLAISDPTGTLATPLPILAHVSRAADAAAIAELARQLEAVLIVVGQALDDEGQPSFQGRKSARLAEAIHLATQLPVELWDESTSTLEARALQGEMVRRKKARSTHVDSLAAAVILRSYLEAHRQG